MAIRDLKYSYLCFVLFSFYSLTCADLKFTDYTLKDYTKTLQGHRFSYEFFEYIQNNSTKTLLSNNREALENAICLYQLNTIYEHIVSLDIWALRVPDSWGHVPSGLLYGNFFDLGNFDECLRVHKEISSNNVIDGKYCTGNLPIGKMISLPDLIFLKFATCIPAVCNVDFADSLFKAYLQNMLNITIGSDITILKEDECKIRDREPMSGLAIATLSILVIMSTIAVICTLLDYFYTKSDRKLHPLIGIWSIRSNSRQVFRIVDNSDNPNVIPCLNGIRCLSITWVIFGHTFYNEVLSPNLNTIEFADFLQQPFSMFLSQGFYSVDSFFFLSALLLVMIVLREMDKTGGKLNLPLMYLHRYLRLTPLVGFALLIYLSMRFVSYGPYWKTIGWGRFEDCEDNWWLLLLYVQNYVQSDKMCMSFTWYLAVDMQLYILSPIVIYAMWKWGKKGVAATVILGLLTWACLFSIIMINDYRLFYKNLITSLDSMKSIYFPTHARASPWIVGLIFGYYLHKIKGKPIKLSMFQVLLGWSISFSLIAATLFSLFPKGQSSATPLTTLEEASFISLSRIAWPLALCWIVFACMKGYGGPINSFLGSPVWQPMVRLSYCMYIFHCFILNLNSGRVRTNTYFSAYDLMLHFWAGFGFTLIISVFMHLVIEAPLAGIEQLLFQIKKQPKRVDNEKSEKCDEIETKESTKEITKL